MSTPEKTGESLALNVITGIVAVLMTATAHDAHIEHSYTAPQEDSNPGVGNSQTHSNSRVEELCAAYYSKAEAYGRRFWRRNLSLRDRIDLCDAESAAGYGLWRAALSWDESRGDFEPWMKRHVRYEIWEESRQATLVSRSAMQKLKELREAELRFEEQMGRGPNVDELAAELGMSPDQVGHLYELRNLAREPSEFDVAAAEEAVEAAAEAEERVAAAMSAFGPLSGDERVVLALHYLEGISFRDVAQILNKRPETISRIHSRAKGLAAQYLNKLGEVA